ncbi:MAG: hypothetical protein OSB03_18925, partial [Vicinamibacterales bacterium]|nr:hypothetical protein [Vicinamibacterales bacterium]
PKPAAPAAGDPPAAAKGSLTEIMQTHAHDGGAVQHMRVFRHYTPPGFLGDVSSHGYYDATAEVLAFDTGTVGVGTNIVPTDKHGVSSLAAVDNVAQYNNLQAQQEDGCSLRAVADSTKVKQNGWTASSLDYAQPRPAYQSLSSAQWQLHGLTGLSGAGVIFERAYTLKAEQYDRQTVLGSAAENKGPNPMPYNAKCLVDVDVFDPADSSATGGGGGGVTVTHGGLYLVTPEKPGAGADENYGGRKTDIGGDRHQQKFPLYVPLPQMFPVVGAQSLWKGKGIAVPSTGGKIDKDVYLSAKASSGDKVTAPISYEQLVLNPFNATEMDACQSIGWGVGQEGIGVTGRKAAISVMRGANEVSYVSKNFPIIGYRSSGAQGGMPAHSSPSKLETSQVDPKYTARFASAACANGHWKSTADEAWRCFAGVQTGSSQERTCGGMLAEYAHEAICWNASLNLAFGSSSRADAAGLWRIVEGGLYNSVDPEVPWVGQTTTSDPTHADVTKSQSHFGLVNTAGDPSKYQSVVDDGLSTFQSYGYVSATHKSVLSTPVGEWAGGKGATVSVAGQMAFSEPAGNCVPYDVCATSGRN